MNTASFLLLIVLFFQIGAKADTLFYGGDFDPNNPNANGLANENDAIVHGDPYGAATYQNFVVSSGQSWNVTGLFSDDFMFTLNPKTAYWEIRSGVSEGNSGTLLASGTGNDTVTLINYYYDFGDYKNLVSGLNVTLGPGTYWFAVVPQARDQQGRSFNVNTFGLNAIGTQISDKQFFNSPFFNTNFTNADNIAVYPTFSSGVDGTVVPEPASIVIFASGVMAAVAAGRRKMRL